MKICLKKKQNKTLNKANLTKQKRNDQNKKKGKNFPALSPRPLTCKVDALSIAPRQQVLSIDVKLIIFNVFAHEILPADAL